jgi:hypothetical protein
LNDKPSHVFVSRVTNVVEEEAIILVDSFTTPINLKCHFHRDSPSTIEPKLLPMLVLKVPILSDRELFLLLPLLFVSNSGMNQACPVREGLCGGALEGRVLACTFPIRVRRAEIDVHQFPHTLGIETQAEA